MVFDVYVDVPITLVQSGCFGAKFVLVAALFSDDALLLERPRGVIDGETTLWWVALTTRALKVCKVRVTKHARGYGVSVADDDPFRIQESIEIRARLFDLLAYVDNLFRQDFPNVSDAFVLFSKFDVCPDTLDEQEWYLRFEATPESRVRILYLPPKCDRHHTTND